MAALRPVAQLLTRRSIAATACRGGARFLSGQAKPHSYPKSPRVQVLLAAKGKQLQLCTRWYSDSRASPEDQASKIYDFDAVKALISQPKEERILIDVREPSEFAAGHIPSALNMPITSNPEALFLAPEEFEDRFGFEKPDTKGDEVVFYCKSGVRSGAAAKFAMQSGYESVGEYKGSWLDWEKHGGPREP